MKIAFILGRFWYPAGMERVITIRANELCKEYDITIVTPNQYPKKDFYELDKRIHREDLIISNNDYRQVLTDYLLKSKFDITVSTGGAEFFFLHKIKDGSKKIFEFHFSFDISKVWCLEIKNPIKRWFYIKLQTYRRIYHARKYDLVIVLSKTDLKKWKRVANNVTYIYNPITIPTGHVSKCDTKNAIAVGRIQEQKGFDLLVEAWSIVNEKHPNWILNIYGDGSEEKKTALQELINKKNLQSSFILRGRTSNIVEKYLESSIFILSSRAEGFPLVLLEASSCGLPLIAFDCPSGPSEIIENGRNGFVVGKVGDIQALAQKICYLIENPVRRKEIGTESARLSKRFQLDAIIDQWKSIYQNVINS